MPDFNDIKFKGQAENYSTLKAGLKRSDLDGNAQLQSIFDAIDTANENGVKDGVLDEQETKTFMQKIIEFAKGGRATKLSSKEAHKLLQSLGLKNVDAANLFGLLNMFSNLSKNIKQTTKTQNNSNIIEYTDGHTEEILEDGSKILTVKNGNTTTVTKSNKDGKITSKTETTVENGIETVIEYEGETPKTKTVKNNNTISTYTLTNGTETLVKEENTQTGDITTYQDGTKTITKQDGTIIVEKDGITTTTSSDGTKIVEKDGTTTTTSSDGNTTIVNTEDSTVTTEKNPEDNSETVTTTNNDGTTTILSKKDGKVRSQTIIKDGQSYSVEYDGNGNTKGVIVQHGESPAQIARRFGVSLDSLLEVNAGVLKGKGSNKYFEVGQEIVIPGEKKADEFYRLNSGRQTKEQAIAKYTQFVQARQAQIEAEDKELASRKGHARIFTEQIWNTFEECARAYYRREGVTNPTKRQIELRVKELKELNPNLKDGEIKGKKIKATFNPETDAQIGAGQQKREAARMAQKQKSEAATGKSMAKVMYDAIYDHWGGVSEDDFQATLSKVNKDNVIGLLKQYDELSPDETLIEAIMDEVWNTLETRRNAVQKIINALIQRAESANVSDERQKQAIDDCKKELNSYWSLGIGYCSTSKLVSLVKNLIGTIDAAEALTREEKHQMRKDNAIDETLGLMNNQVTENTSALEAQLAEDGWCADLWEGIKWCAGSDNLDEKVKADLDKYKGYIQELQKAEQAGGEAGFKAKFKEIFGVDYDPNLMKGYNKLQYNYAMAQSLSMQLGGFYSEFSSCLRGQENYSSMRAKYGQYLAQSALAEGQNIDANKAVDAVIAAQLKNEGLDISKATDAQKQQALRKVIYNTYKAIDAELQKYTQGRSLSNMEQQLKSAGTAVFGNKHDIAYRVSDYIASQQSGGAIVNMVVKTVATIAISVATCGTGLAAISAVAVTSAVVSAGVDISDRASSDVGLKDGEIISILKNATIDGASVFAGGVVGKYAAMFKNANSFVRAGGKLSMMAAGDVGTGAAAEYLQTGTITLEGVVFQAVFSVAGNLVSLKQVPNADAPKPQASGEPQPVRVSRGVKGDVNNHRDVIADGEVARNADQSHLSANERQMVEQGLEDVPTPDELAQYRRENGYEPVPEADQQAYQNHQAQVAADYADAHRIENNAVIIEQKAPTVPKEAIDKLNDEIRGIDGSIRRIEQQIAGAKRFGKNTEALEKQLQHLQQKRATKMTELEAMQKPATEPEVVAKDEHAEHIDNSNNAVEVEADNIIFHAVNDIDVEIPSTYRQLWDNCKTKINNIIDEIKTFSGNLKALQTKCQALFNDLDTIAKNASASIKAKINEMKQNIRKMFNSLTTKEVNPSEVRYLREVNPIEQSQSFNTTHKIDAGTRVADGYKDGGRGLRFDNNGNPINQPSREIILVNRQQDKKLQDIITDVKNKTANMNEKQKATFLQKYICEISGGKHIDETIMNTFSKNHIGQEILLGDIITAKPAVAVCRHRSLLYKILGDEIGLSVKLQRGNFYDNIRGGGHAWNIIQFEDGTSAIFDAMHNKSSNTTPGHVDDYAKQYYTVDNHQLYANGFDDAGIFIHINNEGVSFTPQQHVEIGQYADYSHAPAGSSLPKNVGVLLKGNETLKLANYDLDLGSPEIQAKLNAMKNGDIIIVGREVDAKGIMINDPSSTVSRQHLTIKKVGDKFVVTDISSNGTKIASSLPTINENELVRVAGNNGKAVDAGYVQASREARGFLNDAIDSGEYTQSLDSYIQTINNMHIISATGKSGQLNWYSNVGQGGIQINPGQIRQGYCSNSRYHEATEIEAIARKYGDPYRVSNQSQRVKLKGIPEEYQPLDINTEDGGYRHIYPNGGSLEKYYYKEMHRTATEALELIKRGASETKILYKIAEHYQYAANARPYGQINNSLFMNEINTLLKKAGLKGMPHGMLDHAAMRLQPEAFKKYFVDEYRRTAV